MRGSPPHIHIYYLRNPPASPSYPQFSHLTLIKCIHPGGNPPPTDLRSSDPHFGQYIFSYLAGAAARPLVVLLADINVDITICAVRGTELIHSPLGLVLR